MKLTYETPDEHDRAILSGTAAAPGLPPARRGRCLQERAPARHPRRRRETAPAARPAITCPSSGAPRPHAIESGTQIEDLSAQAAACGLDQNKIKTSVAKILADAGFKSQPYGNEESYVLVSVVTGSRLSDGTCVSRYDASVMAQADATFPYLKGLVLIEVPLLRQGGMAGGSPAVHAAAIMDALSKAVAGFVSPDSRRGQP